MDNSTGLRIAGAGIHVSGRELNARSNTLGEFSITANPGDSIHIRKEGYTNYSQKINAASDLFIKLQPVIRLTEVTVTSQTKKQEMDEIKKQYRKKGSYYEGKPPLLSYIFTPLTALYELVGKTPRQARRFNNYYNRELQETEIDRRFNRFTVGKYSGFDGMDLQNFMENYRPQYSELIGWDEYKLLLYIKNSAQKFVSNGKPAGKFALPVLPKAPDLSIKMKEN